MTRSGGASGRRHPIAAYIAKRIGSGLLVVLAEAIVVFAAVSFLPGNVVTAVLGRSVSPQGAALLIHQLGLDKPWPARLVTWLAGFLRGDLGQSLAAHESVTSLAAPRLINSTILALSALVLLIPFAVGVGAYTGVRAGHWADRVLSSVTLTLIATPEFVMGSLLAYIFGVSLHILPAVSLFDPGTGPLGEPAVLVLPVVTLVLVNFGYSARIVRAGVAESMQSEYVKMARLNGIPERRVVWRYGLRNALAPSIQMLALTAQYLIGGVVVVETVFQYPGVGLLLVDSAGTRDIAVIQALAVVLAAIYIGVNIATDITITLVTPRLRTSL